MEFIYNDGGRNKYFKASGVKDCAVRAISIATNKDYKEVYDALKKINKGDSCRNGTPKKVSKKYLASIGWKWQPCIGFGTGVLVHLDSNELPNEGTFIAQVSKHLACVRDGALEDTYDCSRNDSRAVYGIWYDPKELTESMEAFIDRMNKRCHCKVIL